VSADGVNKLLALDDPETNSTAVSSIYVYIHLHIYTYMHVYVCICMYI